MEGPTSPTQPKLRVLRIMEYVYDDPDRMADDMARWHVQSQAQFGRMSIKSTALPLEILEEDEPCVTTR